MKSKSFLGSNIKYFRESEKLTKEKLADIVGSTGAQILNIESNKIPSPSYPLIESFADYFGVDNIRSLVREDLRGLNPRQLKLMRAKKNLLNLSPNELRSLFVVIDDLNQINIEKGHYRLKKRQISK